MNPWDLSAADLMIWGLVAHLVADWPLQNDWMANNKANLRHPAGWLHAGIHGMLLTWVFGFVALPLAAAHLLIDTRKPVVWWSKLIGQTQPEGNEVKVLIRDRSPSVRPAYDIGLEVRFWTDQVFHIACIAVAALAVAA